MINTPTVYQIDNTPSPVPYHLHNISDINNLQTTLNNKSDSSHTHTKINNALTINSRARSRIFRNS